MMSEDNFWHMSQCTREVRGQCFGVSSHPPCFWPPILLQKPTLGLQTQAVKSGFLKFHLGGNSSFSHTAILPALRNELMKIFLSPFPKELMEPCYLKKWFKAVTASMMVPRSHCRLHSEPIPCYAFRCGIHCILNTLIPSGVRREFRHCCEWVNTRIFHIIINSLIFKGSTFSP